MDATVSPVLQKRAWRLNGSYCLTSTPEESMEAEWKLLSHQYSRREHGG